MRTIYIAYDNTQFEDEYDCLNYEFFTTHDISKVVVIDESGSRIPFNWDDISRIDDFYNCAEGLFIPDPASLANFTEVAEYCGWCEFQTIDAIGKWYRLHSGEWKHNELT